MKKIIVLALLFLMIGCSPPNQQNNPQDVKECTTSSDCIPASCCHASSCVPKEKAPNCSDMFCTLECTPNTLDCNQGFCSCINNKCQVNFN